MLLDELDVSPSRIYAHDELDAGPFRIYAAAIDTPEGYVAAAAVCRREQAGMREAWRDLDLGAGQRWRRSEDALRFAVARARQLIEDAGLELEPCEVEVGDG